MATLSTALPAAGSSPAIIIPCKSSALAFSFDDLNKHVSEFQKKLARLGIAPRDTVSIALPNSYECMVAFLATAKQRAIAAPLNPAFKQEEFEFYVRDLTSVVVLVPQNTFQRGGPAVQAACNSKAAIAECYWNGREVVLAVKDPGNLTNVTGEKMSESRPDDVALVLHTSGTTGGPKAVNNP
ncbi:MAG: hypothetical protein Q9196_003454 [Gyalolechia fulgens]